MLRGFIQKSFASLEQQSDLPIYQPPSAPA
jgi:hypothetical protein